MPGVASEARLGDWRGQGYLELITEGYSRIEGVFFAPPDTLSQVLRFFREHRLLMFRGLCWFSDSPDVCTRQVYIRAFNTETGRIRVHLEAPTVGDLPQLI